MARLLPPLILLPVVALAGDGHETLANPSAADRIVVGKRLPGCGQLERFRYRQGAQTGELWLARVDRRARVTVEATDRPRALATFVTTSPNAVVVNGGFYGGGRPSGLVVSHGVELAPRRDRGGSGVFFVDGDRPHIVHRDEFLATDSIEQAVQSIDRLVDDGAILVSNRDDLPRDARSFVAIDAGGMILLGALFDSRSVVFETEERVRLGRKSTTTGPTLYDLAELGARPASAGGLEARWLLNLDGGWSTSMVAWCDGGRLELAAYEATINAIVARWPQHAEDLRNPGR